MKTTAAGEKEVKQQNIQASEFERLKQKQERTEEALRSSENRYRLVVDNLKDIVFQTDAQGHWLFLNPAWEEVTGFTVKESLGQLFLNYVWPEDRELNQQRFLPLVERKKSYCRHHIRYTTKDGNPCWMEVYARLTLDENDNIIGTSGTITDISQRKETELELEQYRSHLEELVAERTIELEKAYSKIDQANKELSVLDQAKNGFMHLISHELRTPLNGILGLTNILKDMVDSPEILKYVHYLDESARRLEKFSYQALLITNLRSGNYKIDSEKLRIEDLFAHSMAILKEKTNKKGIAVHLHNDGASHFLEGDRELLQICFDRLLDNSVKYSPKDSDVLLNISSGDNSVVCDFIDCGSGFCQDILENPFRAFPNPSEHVDKNTGLNLLLVKYIMDVHNGQIDIFCNENKGAKVRLTFVDQKAVSL